MKNYLFIILVISFFLFTACDNKKPLAGQDVSDKVNSPVEVIQFHSEHRCVTCIKIEKLSRETLDKYFSEISFRLVNVDDKNNEKITEQFEAFGTSLFLYNVISGNKKDLTEFAFMNVGNEETFETELKKLIEDFINN